MGESVYDRIVNLLVESGVDAEDITPQSILMDDLGLDSLDIAELSMGLEDTFDLTIDEEDVITNGMTMQELVAVVEDRIAKKLKK